MLSLAASMHIIIHSVDTKANMAVHQLAVLSFFFFPRMTSS